LGYHLDGVRGRQSFSYSLPLPRANSGRPLPDIVLGFKACLGVPKHPSNCEAFIKDALPPLAQRHDNLLELVNVVFDEDPFAACASYKPVASTSLAMYYLQSPRMHNLLLRG